MTIENPSFETARTSAPVGAAANWTIATFFTLEEFACFTGDIGSFEEWGVERFETGWGLGGIAQAGLLVFEGFTLDLDLATFDPSPGTEFAEDFEERWGAPAVPFLGAVELAAFDGENAEDFEESWGATPLSLADAALDTAVFNGAGAEDFEAGWGTVFADLAAAGSEFALFEAAPLSLVQHEPFNSGGPWGLMTTI